MALKCVVLMRVERTLEALPVDLRLQPDVTVVTRMAISPETAKKPLKDATDATKLDIWPKIATMKLKVVINSLIIQF